MELVTIIVPAYNEEKKIEKCLMSISNQRLPPKVDLNVIIVANACSDKTAAIATRFIEKNNYNNWTILSIKTRGKCNAINKALSLIDSRSKYVGYMDSDCELERAAISKMYNAFKKNSELKLVGALDVPIITSLKTLLSKVQLTNQIHRETRGRVIPVGRSCMFIDRLVGKLPLEIHSEDTWLALDTAKKYGWKSIKVEDEAIVFFTPASNWLDYIEQESKYEAGFLQLIGKYPKLLSIWEKRRDGFKKQKKPEEISKVLKTRLEKEGLQYDELLELRRFLLEIIDDNANIMVSKLINTEGIWSPVVSTKT